MACFGSTDAMVLSFAQFVNRIYKTQYKVMINQALLLGNGMKIQARCLAGVYPQQAMAQILLMADEIEPF